MKRIRLALASALALCAVPAFAQVSVSVAQPGFYGRLDLGGLPQPEVVYARPVIIERAPNVQAAPPLYLRVPPGHQKNWRKHCGAYDACGRPVYFVREDWYQRVYEPRHRGDSDRGPHGDRDRGERDGRGDHDDHDRGRGNGRGNGRGRDH